jgi:KaiC/GvpD/RAD55 family RecA-like ATPase
MKISTMNMQRVSSGVKGVDNLIGGGFPDGSVVLVSGTPGTGKTIFGMQFLNEGVRNKEMGIYISFEQEKRDIIRQASQFGWDFAALEKKNLIKIVSMWPSSFDEVLTKIFKSLYYKPKRLVIDSITSITYSMMDNREAIHKMAEKLKKTKLTALLTSELLAGDKGISRDGISEFVSDGVIVLNSLEAAGEHKNLLRVEKMRSTKINKESHVYDITERGFELTAPTKA